MSGLHNQTTAVAAGATTKKVLEKARVLFDWNATGETQLMLKAGNILTVLSKCEEECGSNSEWWEGEREGRAGFFPKSHVEVIPAVDPLCLVVADFNEPADEDDVLSLKTGNVVALIDSSAEDWWLVGFDDKVGWFPASFLRFFTDKDLESQGKGKDRRAMWRKTVDMTRNADKLAEIAKKGAPNTSTSKKSSTATPTTAEKKRESKHHKHKSSKDDTATTTTTTAAAMMSGGGVGSGAGESRTPSKHSHRSKTPHKHHSHKADNNNNNNETTNAAAGGETTRHTIAVQSYVTQAAGSPVRHHLGASMPGGTGMNNEAATGGGGGIPEIKWAAPTTTISDENSMESKMMKRMDVLFAKMQELRGISEIMSSKLDDFLLKESQILDRLTKLESFITSSSKPSTTTPTTQTKQTK